MLDLQKLEAAAAEMRPLPPSLVRLTRAVASNTSSLDEIVEIIALDEALTLSLLRAVNSAAMAQRRPIAGIKQAVVAFGTGPLVALVMGRQLHQHLSVPLVGYELEERELWQHSVASALAAELAMEFVGVPVPTEAFTAALLHDLGKLVLVRFFDPDLVTALRRAREEGELDGLDAENELLGVHHGELGQLVAQLWDLPESLARAIGAYHAPTDLDGAVADVVHLSDVVAKLIGAGKSLDREPPSVRPDVAGRLGIDASQLERLTAKTAGSFAAVLARYEA